MKILPIKTWLNVTLVIWLSLLMAMNATSAEFITYYHSDHLGSPIATSNEFGELISYDRYTPYGEQISSLQSGTTSGESIAYTGHTNDELIDLTYAGARYYDPSIGRFYSNDPVGFLEQNPLSFNRYAYANNNPYQYVDPDGNLPAEYYGAEALRSQYSAGTLVSDYCVGCAHFRAPTPEETSAFLRNSAKNVAIAVAYEATGTALAAGLVRTTAWAYRGFKASRVPKGVPKLLTHSRGVGGNGAASELGNLGSRSATEVREMLQAAGFEGKSIAKSGYQRFKHSDGSEIWANWQTGRIVRNAAPKYGSNGARINKGQRLGSDGAEIPRNIPHDQHPVESFIP